jgi:hypothetical protein
MNVEKINKDLEKINNQIATLNSKKKELEAKKKAAIDAELANVFSRKKVDSEEFLVLNHLNEEQIRKLLTDAKKMADVETDVKKESAES